MGGSSTGTATVSTSGGGRGSTSTTIASPISVTDPFSGYYASPTSAGLGNNTILQSQQAISLSTASSNGSTTGGGTTTSTGASNNLNAILTKVGTFGIPEYTNIYATTTTATAATTTQNSTGFNSLATLKRTPQFATVLDPDQFYVPSSTAPMGDVARNLQNSLQQSISIPSGRNITVGADGQTVVLRGVVATERERRVAESQCLITPGVSLVRNEITVAAAPK
jgi:hypothetical protein